MLYLIAGISFVVFGGLLFLYRFAEQKGFCLRAFFRKLFFNFINLFRKEKKEYIDKEYKIFTYSSFRKVIAVFVGITFLVRYMSFRELQLIPASESGISFKTAGAGPWGIPFLNQFGNFVIWFEIAAAIMIILEPFFDSKAVKFISLYVATPLIGIVTLGMPFAYSMMTNKENIGLTFILYGIEVGILLSILILNWISNGKTKFYRPTVVKGLIAAFIILLFSIPTYLPQSIFGQANPLWHVKDLSSTHRIFIYSFIIIPPLPLYFFLRNQSKAFIRYCLLAITLGVMIIFVAFTKYDAFVEPWRWPLHLCNTVVFILPICFIFKPKRLFYFTYFINVFGAMFAILMPNTEASVNLMDPDIWRYWYDHAIAFWMPLLAVAVKVYDRPKLKQYFYSTIFLSIYYVSCLFLNAIFYSYAWTTFTLFGKTHIVDTTNFFFLNSDFLPSKLGEFGKNVFRKTVEIPLQNAPRPLIFHPPFQIAYFIIYFLLGFGMWFVYVLFFKISEDHYELHLRITAIKQDRLALESVLDGRSIEEPMEKNAGISYKLIDFSKKYAGRKVFAVEHANLEVHGGEIFGFLGPNGAGKSTIIKSTVGIQPITSGKIEICGFDVQSQPIQAKFQIGFVPDHYALYEKLSGREYLNYIADIYKVSKEDREERLNKYVKLFELENAIDNKIKTYSHGMKQKVTIMAALIHDPKIWILDEPLTGLDPQSIFQVKQCMIEHARRGNIVFFSSHIIDVVEKLCDKIAIIKNGHILCVRDTKDVEAEAGSLERYYLDMIGDTVTERK